jgi:tetratricopeptide (TPR) repeat protein
MRDMRTARDLTLRDLGKLTTYSHTYLWELETGRKKPNATVARRIDDALQADGRLVALVVSDGCPADHDDLDRLAHVAANPRTVDSAAIESLRAILGHQRRLEDSLGSGPFIAPAMVQLANIEDLVTDAHGKLRPDVIDLAAQWGQFVGWLHAANGKPERARDLYARVLEWATEIGDANMIATALNLRGHLAWQARQPGPVIGLSAAALRQPATPGVLALAAQQQARGHALVREAHEVDAKLDQAAELAAAAAARPDREPPWTYFYSGDYLTMQRGLAHRLLGRHTEAIEQLIAGLAALPAEMRRSEWVGTYVLHLALAHEAAGNHDEAVRAADEARQIATMTGSQRLARQVEKLARRLRL